MIYQRLNRNQFVEHLMSDPYANWTRTGAEALYDYLDDTGSNVEMDRVALRCEFTDCTAQDLIDEYSYLTDRETCDCDEHPDYRTGTDWHQDGCDDDEPDQDYAQRIADQLTETTTVLPHNNGWVIGTA